MQPNFPIHRPVAGHGAAMRCERQRQQTLRQRIGCGQALRRRQAAAVCAQLLAQRISVLGHRCLAAQSVSHCRMRARACLACVRCGPQLRLRCGRADRAVRCAHCRDMSPASASAHAGAMQRARRHTRQRHRHSTSAATATATHRQCSFSQRTSDHQTRKKKRRPKASFQICILRRDDAGETTLNPGFKWGRCEAIGLPATRRTCTPGFVAPPWS